MKENKYDDPAFFEQYHQMARSVKGLEGAGEWHELQKMLPDFKGKKVLDLGCGFGWHCRYAVEQGAASVLGIDISARMIETAQQKNALPGIEYRNVAIEDLNVPGAPFDVVISSLTFHYLADFNAICQQVNRLLRVGGDFVFSVEHPVFTANGNQQWVTDEKGNHLHWPVDRYFDEGVRNTVFLGEPVLKYHRTLTTYISNLLNNGFKIATVTEPQPAGEMLKNVPGMADELRRPMMLLVAAVKEL